MGVFVSYSTREKDAVTRLTQDLQDAEEHVWLDRRLAGGDAWWRAILEQIRGCDVFIFALSQNSIQSKPCQAELHYAQDLGLPILPVQVGPVDSMQLNPLATVQTVDYRTSTSTAGMRLLSALHRARTQRQPLPSPLPPEPPVPFEYLIRLYTTIAGTDQLSPRDQAALVTQLQFGLREDGDHEAARKDIVMLLGKLRDREDVTYRTRTDVDIILATVGSALRPESAAQPANLTAIADTPGLPVDTARPSVAGDATSADAPVSRKREFISEPGPPEKLEPIFPNSLAMAGALIVLGALLGPVGSIIILSGHYSRSTRDAFWTTGLLSLILIAISFCILAWKARSESAKLSMVIGWAMVVVTLLLALRDLVILIHPSGPSWMLSHPYYVIVSASYSLVGIAFGVAVYRSKRVRWATLLILWGLFHLVDTVLAWSVPNRATSYVAIVRAIILLATGILMYTESRLAKNEPAATSL